MKKIDTSKIVPCQLRIIGLSCWGCCGREFQGKDKVNFDIKINTQEFETIKRDATQEDLIDFMERYNEDPNALTPSGICSNLVKFKGGCYGCPLHSRINEIVSKDEFEFPYDEDLRVDYCDVNEECVTFKIWKSFDEEKRLSFIEFLEKKNLNHYSYSTNTVNGNLIKEFLVEIDGIAYEENY